MCVVWLKNIDRILNLIPKYYDLKNYHFMDIGCGSGISTIYFKKNYEFKTYSGVDFEKIFIEYCEINKRNSSTDDIQFSIEDVTYLILQDKPYFLFLFNPFGPKTIKSFIKNNLQNLKNNNSIIGYVNDLHINHFTDYDVQIIRDDFYNISLDNNLMSFYLKILFPSMRVTLGNKYYLQIASIKFFRKLKVINHNYI